MTESPGYRYSAFYPISPVMIFKDCYPDIIAGKLAQVYRLRHFIIPEKIKTTPKPYPTRPEHCIVFYIRGFELTEIPGSGILKRVRSIISGQYTHRINRYSGSAEFLMVQAVLWPGIVHRLTGIPAHELQNNFIDLEDVFPKEGREINERLQNSTDYNTIIRTIDEFMGGLAGKMKISERPADEVFQIMLQYPGKYSIDWLAREACLSPRQFERKAYDYVGVCPKLFSRICRFIHTYDMRQSDPKIDWLSIALAAGYQDYQHMVKDYLYLAGTRPTWLFKTEESKALERRLGLKK